MHRTLKLLTSLLLGIAVVLISSLPSSAQPRFGNVVTVGRMNGAFVHNITLGKMILCDEQDGVHFTWELRRDAGPSKICYNYLDVNNELLIPADDPNYVNYEMSGSQPTISFHPVYGAVIFYGEYDAPNLNTFRACAAYDFDYAFGAFSRVIMYEGNANAAPLQPKGCIDRNGDTYLASAIVIPDQQDGLQANIWGATEAGEMDWQVSQPEVFDTLAIPGYLLTASPVSDQIAVVWHKNLAGFPVPERWNNFMGVFQRNNDLRVAISEGRGEWDFGNSINITRTILPNQDLQGVAAFGDTLRPYDDLDAIWVGEVLHVVFTTRGLCLNPDPDAENPLDHRTWAESLIWHWDSESDTLTLVADGWYDEGRDVQFVTANVSQPSIGADEAGNLYCLFRQINLEDEAAEIFSADLMLSRSEDGNVWSMPINLTDTHLDGAEAAAINEFNSSLAERVNDNLNISYIQGWAVADNAQEGELIRAENVQYLQIPVANMPNPEPLPMPRRDFKYHIDLPEVAPDGISNDQTNPVKFALAGVHPNPFNAQTVISFDMARAGMVDVGVFDLSGRRVATVVAGEFPAGRNQVTWDAREFGAGVYLIKIATANEALFERIALVK